MPGWGNFPWGHRIGKNVRVHSTASFCIGNPLPEMLVSVAMWQVLVTDEMRLGEIKNPEVRLDYRPNMPREEILRVIGKYDAIITRSRTQVDSELLEAGTRLKVVGRGGVGVDNVDLEAASRRGILVVNVPEANTRSA